MTSINLTEFQGQPALYLRSPDGAQATILVHGAHLVSWIPAGGEEQLYLSPQTRYGMGASVRGGVPVVFPQFNQRGPLPKHGLLRTRSWEPVQAVVRKQHAIGTLRFRDDIATRTHWPHGFEAELTVSISGRELDIELAVTNTGESTFEFNAALHTYLRCADVLKAQLEGLQGCQYEDALLGQFAQQWGDVTAVVGALDRVYHDVSRELILREMGRRLSINLTDFEDVVVWNPGPEGAHQLADLPDDHWQQMLCVEAARIRNPIRLVPGEDWAGRQSFRC
jgi:glucose-6-phosphate 1-epimerase